MDHMDEHIGPTVQVADGVYEVISDEPGFCPDCERIHRDDEPCVLPEEGPGDETCGCSNPYCQA
jgi:hypothetical protein